MTELRPYQVADLSFFLRPANKRAMNLSDPGTGKTAPACVWLYWLWTQGKRSFWAMPKSLLKKNRVELLEFSNFKPEDVVIYDGPPARRERLRKCGAKVWLMGFDRFADDWEALLELHPDFDALLVDEFHMGFSGVGSGRTNGMFRAMERLTYFQVMTGTLIDGKLDTAYPAIHVIEPRYYGNHDAFLNFHGEYDFDGKLTGWKNHWKLQEIFKRHGIRHTFEEIYGPSAIVIQKEVVEMSEAQRKAYAQVHDQAMLELDDAFLDASLPGVAIIRARQIMAHPESMPHPMYLAWKDLVKLAKERDMPPPRPYEGPKRADISGGQVTGKDERLLVHVEDHKRTKKPMIIYAALVPEQERLAGLLEKAGRRVGLINGDVSARQRGLIDEAFRAGKLDDLVGSPATASVGYNWGHVDHIVCASVDYKDSNFNQAIRRAERGTRTKPLLVTVLEYEDSVDQRIFMIVDWKAKNAKMVDETNPELKLYTPAAERRGVTMEEMVR